METDKTTQRVPIRELVKYYLRLGLLGFGGPVALVGQMEREMVGERKWLTKDEMREGIAVCQSLPRSPSRLAFGSRTSAVAFGGRGPAAGRLSCPTSSSSPPSARSTFGSRAFQRWQRSSTGSALR